MTWQMYERAGRQATRPALVHMARPARAGRLDSVYANVHLAYGGGGYELYGTISGRRQAMLFSGEVQRGYVGGVDGRHDVFVTPGDGQRRRRHSYHDGRQREYRCGYMPRRYQHVSLLSADAGGQRA